MLFDVVVVLDRTIDRKEVSASRLDNTRVCKQTNAVAVAGNREAERDIKAMLVLVVVVVVKTDAVDRRRRLGIRTSADDGARNHQVEREVV